jgi:hypothetical protein
MLELYFILYRVPKTMTRLARERNRSAVAWSLIGIGAWIGAELLVGFTVAAFYAVGIVFWGWPEESSAPNVVAYLAALVAALVSVHIVTRILMNLPREKTFLSPPPPPLFPTSETDHEVVKTSTG